METPKTIGNTASKTTKKEQYAHVLHSYLYDLNLTCQERILLIYAICNKEGYTFIPKSASKKTGIHIETIYLLLKSLIKKGYCVKTKGKKFKLDNYTFFDKPIAVEKQEIAVQSKLVPSSNQTLDVRPIKTSTTPSNQTLDVRPIKTSTTPSNQTLELNNTINNNISINNTISNIITRKEELVELKKEIIEEEPFLTKEQISEERTEFLWNAFINKHSDKKTLSFEKRKEFAEEIISAISFREITLIPKHLKELKNDIYANFDIEIPVININYEPMF
jgi:hypothetical protein